MKSDGIRPRSRSPWRPVKDFGFYQSISIGGSGQSGYVDRTLWMGGEVVRKRGCDPGGR